MPQDPTTDPTALRALHGALRDADTIQHPKETTVVGIIAFSLPMCFGRLKMAPMWPSRGPGWAHDGRIRPHDRPIGVHERSKRAPICRLRASEETNLLEGPPLFEP
eukprot:2287376-Pyramimonas_sp.AAC.1